MKSFKSFLTESDEGKALINKAAGLARKKKFSEAEELYTQAAKVFREAGNEKKAKWCEMNAKTERVRAEANK